MKSIMKLAAIAAMMIAPTMASADDLGTRSLDTNDNYSIGVFGRRGTNLNSNMCLMATVDSTDPANLYDDDEADGTDNTYLFERAIRLQQGMDANDTLDIQPIAHPIDINYIYPIIVAGY